MHEHLARNVLVEKVVQGWRAEQFNAFVCKLMDSNDWTDEQAAQLEFIIE